jgi:hypothetical protein
MQIHHLGRFHDCRQSPTPRPWSSRFVEADPDLRFPHVSVTDRAPPPPSETGRQGGTVAVFVDGPVHADVAQFQAGSETAQIVSIEGNVTPHPRVALDAYGCSEIEGNLRVIRWLRDWSNAPVLAGRNVKELLLYRGRSLWWFFDAWFVQNVHLPPFTAYLRRVEQLITYVDRERPQRLVSLSTDPVFNRALRLVGASRRLPTEIRRPGSASMRNLRTRATAVLAALRFMPRAVWYRLQRLLYRTPGATGGDAPVALFSMDHWQDVFDLQQERFVRGNLYYHGVMTLITHTRPLRFVANLSARRLGLRYLAEKRAQPRVVYKPFEAYLSMSGLRRTLRAFWRFRKEIQQWCRDPDFAGSWTYMGVDCWEVAAERWNLLSGGPLFESILAVETAEDVLDQDQPVALVIDSEQARPGRALIGAGLLRGTPVISLAHGMTAVDSPYHNLTPADITLGQRRPDCQFPLPDVVTLFAKAEFELLTQRGCFPPDRLRVTGAPRWDWLARARDLFPKDGVCSEYGLAPQHPIVLFTPQDLPNKDEEKELICAISSVTRDIPGAQLLLKIHPGQTAAHARWYRRLAEDAGAPLRVVERMGLKLYPLLSIADVLVTVGCTTAVEAGLFDVPVVVLDLYGRGYRDYYVKPLGLLEATSSTELDRILRRLLFDVSFRDSLRAPRAEFLREYATGSDGKAAERVVGLVDELVRARGSVR